MKEAHAKTNNSGFTIVELLIVIVVIGILAAISIVAYNGISNQANDSVVKGDLSNIAKELQMIYAETGAYPQGGFVVDAGGATSGHHSYAPGDLRFSVSRSAYLEPTGSGSTNFVYCTGKMQGGEGQAFGIAATSMSSQRLSYSSLTGITLHGGGPSLNNLACAGIENPRSNSSGYSTNQGGWQDWTR